MNGNIYVVDIETTGLAGQRAGDCVVEVGIARVDMLKRRVYPEYSAIVRQVLSPEQAADSWVFKNTTLTPGEVRSSPHSAYDVARILRNVYTGSIPVTSYNRFFDLDLFLSHPPYLWRPAAAPCIKECATAALGFDKWLSAQKAYDILCPENPARVPDGREEHRALSDACLEGYILLEVCRRDPAIAMSYDEAIRDAEAFQEAPYFDGE